MWVSGLKMTWEMIISEGSDSNSMFQRLCRLGWIYKPFKPRALGHPKWIARELRFTNTSWGILEQKNNHASNANICMVDMARETSLANDEISIFLTKISILSPSLWLFLWEITPTNATVKRRDLLFYRTVCESEFVGFAHFYGGLHISQLILKFKSTNALKFQSYHIPSCLLFCV